MAANAVTTGRFPDLPVYELTSDRGTTGRFVGRVTDRGVACRTCGTSDTVTIYQGPQHGLAFDVPRDAIRGLAG